MITFKRRCLLETICRLWPPYRKKRDQKLYESIKWLVDHPEAPCNIEGEIIPSGYGVGILRKQAE